MQFAVLALLPLVHILLVVIFVIAAVANMKKSPALAGALAVMAALSGMVTVVFFLTILRGL